MTLNMVTGQESDTGGAAGPQLWGPSQELETFLHEGLSPEVDGSGPESFSSKGLSPPVEDRKRCGEDQGGLSPPVEDRRRCGEDQGGLSPPAAGLAVRLRRAGLTPPSLLKRSASLAKLDHLQLTTLDLSDLDPQSGRASGGTEPR